MKKRILAAFLALCLMLTMLPGKASAASYSYQLGDVDQSGDISILDLSRISVYISGTSSSFYPDNEALFRVAADLNCDGYVDEADTVLMRQICTDMIESPGRYGTCGANVYWQLSSGMLYIRGTGEMEDYGYQSSPSWNSWSNSITTVQIDCGVTRIGMYAFSDCANLNSVSIPESVTAVSTGAFRGCAQLRSVMLPSGITTLENQTFQYCSSLTYAWVPARVTSIGEYAFQGCTSLTSYSMPESVTQIGMFAFDDCTSLRQVTIPKATVKIDDTSFLDCSSLMEITVNADNSAYCSVDGVLFSKDGTELIRYPVGKTQSSYTVPSGTVRLGEWAFSGSKYLTGVTLPATIRDIDSIAFNGCTALTGIAIPEGVKELDYMQFCNCSALASVTLPVSLTEIGYRVFYGCGALRDIYYRGTEEQWEKVNVSSASGTIQNARIHCLGITAPSYTVTFDANGGNLSNSSLTMTNGSAYGTLPTPTRSMYEFTGWYTRPEGGEEITSESVVSLTADQTLYAHWKSLLSGPVFVTYSPNGGEWYGGISQTFQQKMPGTPLTLSHSGVRRTGYTLAGWSTTATGQVEYKTGDVYTKDEALTLYAVWTPDTFRLVFSPNGGTVTPEEKYVTYDSAYGELPVPTRAGYVFEGWYTALEDGERITASSIVKVAPEDKPILGRVDPRLYACWKEDTQTEITVPQVVTGEAVDITTSGAALHGLVLSDGGSSVTSRRFFYFEKNNTSVIYQVSANSNFTAVLNNLKPDTEYWFYALAQNAKGTGFGEPSRFVTSEKPEPTPTSVSLLPTAGLTMSVGQVGRLTAQVLPEGLPNPGVIWESSDPSVASVTQTGSVTALKEGSATIKVTTEVGRLEASCPVKVRDTPLELNLSEWNMSTNTGIDDPDGWYTSNESGNVPRAMSYLSRWDGPVYEKDDPYAQGGYRECASVYHVQNVQFLRKRSGPLDNNEIKGALVRYGAVSASFLYDNSCYNANTNSYYNPGTLSRGGHAVAIVGWDDNYSASNFKQRPAGDGAFLCKNSYGTAYGDSGYFWVSYYDNQFAIRNITAVFNSVETTDNYSRVYQYDPLGPIGCMFPSSSASSAWEANVFPTTGEVLARTENLQAVSFYTYDKGTRYEVYIVPNWQDATSFRSLGEPREVGTMEYAGYHTVRLSESVRLEAGTRFAVVIRLTNTESGAAFYIESPLSGSGSEYSLRARANAGESWFSTDGVLWKDLTTQSSAGNAVFQNANFCVKAFTDGTPSARDASYAEAFLMEEETPSLEDYLAAGIVFSEEYVEAARAPVLYSSTEEGDVLTSVPVGSSMLSFLDGAQYPVSFDLRLSGDVSEVRNQGSYNTCWAHAALASMESCWLRAAKASQADGSLDGGLIIGSLGTNVGVIVGASVGSNLSFQLNESSKKMAPGASAQLSASVGGMSISVRWASSAPEVAQVDTSGLVSALQVGSAVITATAANGKTATCIITVSANGIAGVTLRKTAVSCRAGEALLLDYEITPAGSTVSWSSSAPSVATVDRQTGKITACAPGSAMITATAAGGTSASCTVTVVGPALCTASGSCSMSETKHCSARVIVENPMKTAIPAWAVLAVYGESGKLCAMKRVDVSLVAGETTVSFADVQCGNVSTEWKARCFLLSKESYTPIAFAAELQH